MGDCEVLYGAVGDHAAVGVRDQDDVASVVEGFVGDGGAGGGEVVFECGAGVAGCGGEGDGRAVEGWVVGLEVGDEFGVAGWEVPGARDED